MRLQAAFVLLASCVPTWAIFADDVNHIDYHHALLGKPQARTTFFHRPSSSSSASLLYTLSEKSILGAVNPKDGSAVWRQNLSDSDAGVGGHGCLRAADGENAVVSAIGSEVSSWGASDGKLGWKHTFNTGVAVDLELAQASPGATGQRDSIALFGGSTTVIKRLDGTTGIAKWEYSDRWVFGSDSIYCGAAPSLTTHMQQRYSFSTLDFLGANVLRLPSVDIVEGFQS